MSERRSMLVTAALVGAITICWILGAPPSAGPDEPAHMVRGAALVRGEFDGAVGGSSGATVELPAWVGYPDPVCYAFAPYQSSACAEARSKPEGSATTTVTATEYPIWGHVLPGVGTLMGPTLSPWASRVLGAVPSVLLIGWAIAATMRSGSMASSAAFFAVTPMAWFMTAVVNPSGLAIAGGVALAAGGPDVPSGNRRWLAVAGWAALALSRRDGLVWASIALSILVLASGRPLLDWWRPLDRLQRVVVGTASALAVVSGVTSGDSTSALVAFAPALVAGTVAARLGWRRWVHNRWHAAVFVVVVGAVTLVGYLALASRRANGFDTYFVRLVMARTGENLVEAIGVLGWLDTPVPLSMVLLWAIGLGVLFALPILSGERWPPTTAALAIGAAIVASWVIESAQEAYSGTYWQGRYYLPLLVLAPIALGRSLLPPDVVRRGSLGVAAIACVVINVSFVAALRRWAVGLDGTYDPTAWNTYGTPLPPVLLIVLHIAASVLLARMVARTVGST